VAYSGQCLTSESLGGRSANRGECAQACRMPYELISDGQLVPLGDRKYLLSPQDLAGLDVLPDLIRAGVASLKIEGRSKRPNMSPTSRGFTGRRWTASTENDRRRLCVSGHRCTAAKYEWKWPFRAACSPAGSAASTTSAGPRALRQKTRRVSRRSQPGRGERVSPPAAKRRSSRATALSSTPANRTSPRRAAVFIKFGGRNGETLLSFGHGDIDFSSRIHPGDKLWKTSDPELDRENAPEFCRRHARAFNAPGNGSPRPSPATAHLIARDEAGTCRPRRFRHAAGLAEKQPLTTEKLREQLGRLGGTPFHPRRLKNALAGAVLLPVSELNRLRRELVANWTASAPSPSAGRMNVPGTGGCVRERADPESLRSPANPVPNPNSSSSSAISPSSKPRCVAA
jgi:putative protease